MNYSVWHLNFSSPDSDDMPDINSDSGSPPEVIVEESVTTKVAKIEEEAIK
jgi:hypothetical protein